ncbi:YifB family Mg chelatase-like AAA ATPase [Candidatus Bipolaricaulota bacterium]|nr:YifB family Mg chelatase-like AAA ATPase [Candidatus Bipolaricaulota bacterium]HHR85297.1 ATP-binding protein [Candidatus Acetothermia bacterium]
MYAHLVSSVVVGIDARSVEIQCDVTGGLPAFQVVGLPEKEVSESRERVRSAIKNSGFTFPAKRITANLAPADLRKEGVGFDLPIALAILLASEQIVGMERRYTIVGELSLNGEVRHVPGVLPIAMLSAHSDCDGLIVPEQNAIEAALVEGIPVYPVSSLAQAAAFIAGLLPIEPFVVDREALLKRAYRVADVDLSDVKGQEMAKRALEISAAGGHNLMMSGPPGAGKSMLAHALPGILPALSFEEALEVTRIYSIAGLLEPGTPLITLPPFRAPHHTISYAGMVGGGHGLPGPGEITLAHHGVLFLDETPEFDRHVLETLRQPLEDRSILLSRAGVSVRYPASFALVGAMNPCPCGHLGDHTHPCTCTLSEIKRYRKRLSGPFLDRVDLFVEVPRLTSEELLARPRGERSSLVQERVKRARRIQLDRFESSSGRFTNAQLSSKEIDRYCELDREGRNLIELAIARLGLSARAYTRTLKVARTIADLDDSPRITSAHLAEAIQYRASDDAL